MDREAWWATVYGSLATTPCTRADGWLFVAPDHPLPRQRSGKDSGACPTASQEATCGYPLLTCRFLAYTKYWSFSFNISPSSEYSGLISFRMDWFDLLAVQGTLKILLQHHSSKSSILQCSAFFMVQLSHPYMTTGKTIALTRPGLGGPASPLLGPAQRPTFPAP